MKSMTKNHVCRVQKWNRFGKISSNGAYTFGISKSEGKRMQPKVQITSETHGQAMIFIKSVIFNIR